MSLGKCLWDVFLVIIGVLFFVLFVYFIEYYNKSKYISNNKNFDDKKKLNKEITDFKSDDLVEAGIGGMDEYFDIINKKIIAIRKIDKKTVNKLGIRPIKGVLLYGKPGCGKTLMAVAIGKYLNCEKPIMISGPEIMSKWIGQSEENIRNLFESAKIDQELGKDTLHLIVFDEFDSIGSKRDTETDPYGIKSSVVNQILAMMDGPNALNNIIIIAITNRKDVIDEALLRPGRFEVHIEIKIPDINQRLDILKVKLKKIEDNGFLSDDVSFEKLAELTDNYSGAEIEGLINSTVSEFIYDKLSNNVEHPKIFMDDFYKHIKVIKPSEPSNNSKKFNQISKLLEASGLSL